jgi:hypothetical protein
MTKTTIEEIIAWASFSHCNQSRKAEVAANLETWQNVNHPALASTFQQPLLEEPHGKVIKRN